MEKLLINANSCLSEWRTYTGQNDAEVSTDCLQRLACVNARVVLPGLLHIHALNKYLPDEWKNWMPLFTRQTEQLVIYYVNVDQASENYENYLIYRIDGENVYLSEWAGDNLVWLSKLALRE